MAMRLVEPFLRNRFRTFQFHLSGPWISGQNSRVHSQALVRNSTSSVSPITNPAAQGRKRGNVSAIRRVHRDNPAHRRLTLKKENPPRAQALQNLRSSAKRKRTETRVIFGLFGPSEPNSGPRSRLAVRAPGPTSEPGKFKPVSTLRNPSTALSFLGP